MGLVGDDRLFLKPAAAAALTVGQPATETCSTTNNNHPPQPPHTHNPHTTPHTHLDVLLEVALERAEEDLALPRLEAVDDRRDRALQVGAREQDQLLVDEVRVRDRVDGLVQVRPRDEAGEPALAVLDALLGEGHLDRVGVVVALPDEALAVRVERREVLLGLGGA